MRILLVVDGSSYSDLATNMLQALALPPQTEVSVMTVVPEFAFLGGITLDAIRGTAQAKKKLREEQQQKALKLVQGAAQTLSESKLKIETLVRWGKPAEAILQEAEERSVSLAVMGAKGLTDPLPFRLGSVAQAVMKHAKASVLLVRPKIASATQGTPAKDRAVTINRVLLATDGSKYSDMVTQLLLALPLPRHTQVIVMTALQSHLSAWIRTPTLNLQTNQELLANLQAAEESEARKITDKARREFQTKGYKTASLVMQGGAGESILAAAREHDPDIIALGSKGLTGIESFLLGSVAERVARYANCSVLIGRAPT